MIQLKKKRKFLAVFLAIALVFSYISVVMADSMPGSIKTTDITGEIVNANTQYMSREDVYLNGGPNNQNAPGLPDGDYYVKITTPGGDLLGTSGNIAPLHVTDGYFDENYKLWDYTFKASDNSPGYDYTSNPGGEYKVWVSQDADFPPDASKTDNFKVKEPKGTLIINKVLAGNDQPASDTVFTVTIGETTETITAGENSFSLAPGTYAIEETDSQGADSIDYSTQSAVIEENQTTTVTITNTFNTDNGGGDPDPENGTLIINKVLAGNDQPASDTVFTVTIGETTETITAGENSFSLAPGTYAIAETNSQGADSIGYSTQSAVIEENQTTTVTITNTFNKENGGGDPQDGTLIVNKIVTGNDRPDGDTEFTITINGEEHIILAGSNTFKLAPGTYTVIETRDRGASSVINRTQTVDLSEGETTTISITNIFNTSGGGGGGGDYTPPEKPEEPVTVTEPPVAAPPLVSDEVTNSPVEEVVTVTEETPAAAQPLPHTGGPVGILWGAGLCISGLGLMIRKRFK